MKQRLNTIDILSLVNDFQRLINMRVNNVYDGNNPQIYFIKLNHAGNKELLYIPPITKNGIRVFLGGMKFQEHEKRYYKLAFELDSFKYNHN